MRKRFFNLQLFTDGGEGGAGAAGIMYPIRWTRQEEGIA